MSTPSSSGKRSGAGVVHDEADPYGVFGLSSLSLQRSNKPNKSRKSTRTQKSVKRSAAPERTAGNASRRCSTPVPKGEDRWVDKHDCHGGKDGLANPSENTRQTNERSCTPIPEGEDSWVEVMSPQGHDRYNGDKKSAGISEKMNNGKDRSSTPVPHDEDAWVQSPQGEEDEAGTSDTHSLDSTPEDEGNSGAGALLNDVPNIQTNEGKSSQGNTAANNNNNEQGAGHGTGAKTSIQRSSEENTCLGSRLNNRDVLKSCTEIPRISLYALRDYYKLNPAAPRKKNNYAQFYGNFNIKSDASWPRESRYQGNMKEYMKMLANSSDVELAKQSVESRKGYRVLSESLWDYSDPTDVDNNPSEHDIIEEERLMSESPEPVENNEPVENIEPDSEQVVPDNSSMNGPDDVGDNLSPPKAIVSSDTRKKISFTPEPERKQTLWRPWSPQTSGAPDVVPEVVPENSSMHTRNGPDDVAARDELSPPKAIVSSNSREKISFASEPEHEQTSTRAREEFPSHTRVIFDPESNSLICVVYNPEALRNKPPSPPRVIQNSDSTANNNEIQQNSTTQNSEANHSSSPIPEPTSAKSEDEDDDRERFCRTKVERTYMPCLLLPARPRPTHVFAPEKDCLAQPPSPNPKKNTSMQPAKDFDEWGEELDYEL